MCSSEKRVKIYMSVGLLNREILLEWLFRRILVLYGAVGLFVLVRQLRSQLGSTACAPVSVPCCVSASHGQQYRFYYDVVVLCERNHDLSRRCMARAQESIATLERYDIAQWPPCCSLSRVMAILWCYLFSRIRLSFSCQTFMSRK